MYSLSENLGLNISAHFDALLQRYLREGEFDSVLDYSGVNAESVDLLLDFGRYIAIYQGERVAIGFCENLHHRLLDDRSLHVHVGRVLILQAELFNQIGKRLSCDLYAVEAAEAFMMYDLVPAAENALSLVRAS